MDIFQDALTRWIEIDLDAITHNITQVKEQLKEDVQVMAVVKGDAYGCGSVACAHAAVAAGCTMLGVTTLEEALELRFQEIDVPILVFSTLLTHEVHLYVQHHLTPTVTNAEALLTLEDIVPDDTSFPIHIKIETGMGRLGLKPEELPAFLAVLENTHNIHLAGIYTHFAKATDRKYVKLQAERLLEAQAVLLENGLKDFLLHACASSTYINYPEYHFDMVRIGTLIYGQIPAGISSKLAIVDPWKVKAKVIQLNNVSSGESIGYGRDYIARKSISIAIIPVGLADGFSLTPPMKAKSLMDLLRIVIKEILKYTALPLKTSNTIFFQGHPLPLIGRVGMQLLAVDASSFPEIKLGDTVELELRRTSASPRLARVYFKEGKVREIRSIVQNAFNEKFARGTEM